MRRFKAYTLDEFDRFIRNFNFTRPINHIQIHHTWKPRKTDYQGEKTIEAIWRYHTETIGWSDIGQHFTISPDGLIWDGRDLNVIPAGISGHNTGGIMFEMIGNFDKGQEVLEGKQLNAILGVVSILLEELNLTTDDIVFHREYSNKTCPGSGIAKDWFIQQMKKWKEEQEKVEKVKITYKGEVMQGVVIDGVSYAPVRVLAESLGLQVNWNSAKKTVELK
ncbi:N-acetylmuramoyl-L-alanine amidase [Tepidibacillus decaturensis]|uniref:Autolysin n=1 Tax=Tepidibacillus decaturensis TaxID=1413211 RepID=A0A135L1Q6_9BACI|nr:N-acetylmuramoyl-L-alanine amidase [Tepidibacillus decaturensis]KXG42886.1 hypothetical protein U473_01700 [Tepidibacillus decaturensis]